MIVHQSRVERQGTEVRPVTRCVCVRLGLVEISEIGTPGNGIGVGAL